MANKRDLKRNIDYICSGLFAECVAASLYGGTQSNETVDGILSSIIMTRSDFIARISHPEPGMNAKTYFKHLAEDFNKQANEVIDQINSLA